MRNKLLAVLLLLPALLCGTATAFSANESETYTVAQVESLRDGIVAYNGAAGGQDFINGALCADAGESAEFYAIALSQSGNYDFSRYESALLYYLDAHDVYSAASREKYALTLAAIGSTDRYIADTADEAIGELGVMSLVFGLHLLNNGYDSCLYSTDGLLSEILSYQRGDGGWAVMGSYGDVDVTAMTLQALAPHYGSRGDVTAAVDSAVELLSQRQLDSGGFKSMGVENCESAAQVIIALSALGIDAQTDGRFVKNGSSAMNGMMQYYAGGGFAHTDGVNDNATLQAYCALTAYCRYGYGQGSLYILDHVNHSAPSNNNASGGSDGSGSGGSGAGGGTGADHGGAASDRSGNDGGSGGADDAPDNRTETDANGNRIIIINGQRYIEATTASGEKVTVKADETQAGASQPSAATVMPSVGNFQSRSTADMRATADEGGRSGGYKLYVILGVLLAAGIACLVLFLLKKRGKKHYIAVAILAAAGILFLLLTDFRSPADTKRHDDSDDTLTVTLSIRCDTIVGREKANRFVPDDGVILEAKEYSAAEGETVYDVLLRAAGEKNIPLDNRGTQGAAYIAGIKSLYEFDYGDLSGWMYRVNGAFPDVGCQSYTVSDGDVIEWLYTTNIGKDLQ